MAPAVAAAASLGLKPAVTSNRRDGRSLRAGAARAVAAPDQTSVYEDIKQNSQFPPETQMPWGFQPPKGFVLPHYNPRAPPSVPTPKQLGYTMPGEFEKHAACWMGWPTSGYLWREGAKPAQQQYAGIAKAISQFEPLKMIASPGVDADLARSFFTDAPNVEVVEIPIRDGWTRDWGPSFVAKTVGGNRSVAGVHWDYDGYGATLKKLLGLPTFMPEEDWAVDYDAGRKLIEATGSRVFDAPIHIEGGSINSDGEGTLVVTEECLLHPSRNPHYGKANIEAVLKEYLGLEKIIWLWKGVAGDDSVVNGHVDNFCCFLAPGVVALAWPDNENDFNDPQWEISTDAFERLSNTTDAKGRKLTIVKVPCPPAIFRTYKEAGGLLPDHYDKGFTPRVPGERLSASYINHYKANGGAVLSKFGAGAAVADQRALDILGEAYCKYLDPNTRVVNVESREVLLNAGNVHCITQQQPAECDRLSSRRRLHMALPGERVGLRFSATLGKAWPAGESRTLLLEVDVEAGGGQGALKCSHTGGDAWVLPACSAGDGSDVAAPQPLKCNSWDSKGRNPSMNVYLHLQPPCASTGGGSASSSSSDGGDGDEPPARYKLGVLVQHALPQLALRLGGYKQLGLDWVTWSAAAAAEGGGGGGGVPVAGSVAAAAAVGAPDAAHWQALEELAKEREQGAGTGGGGSPPPDSAAERALRRAKETLVDSAAFFGPEAASRCSRLTVRKLYNREYHFWDGDKDVADSRRHALEWAVGLAEVEEAMSTNPDLRAKLNERLTGAGREQGGGGPTRKAAKRARPAGAAAPGGGSRRVVLSAGAGGGALSPTAALPQAPAYSMMPAGSTVAGAAGQDLFGGTSAAAHQVLAQLGWQLPEPLLLVQPLPMVQQLQALQSQPSVLSPQRQLAPLPLQTVQQQQQQPFGLRPVPLQQFALPPQQHAQHMQQPAPSLLPSVRTGTVGSAPHSFGQFLDQLQATPSWLSSDLLNQALDVAPLASLAAAGRSGSGSPPAEVLQPSPKRHDPPVHAERRQREQAEPAAAKRARTASGGAGAALPLPAGSAVSQHHQHRQGAVAATARPAAAAAAEPDPLDAALDAWEAHDRVQRQLAEVQREAARRQQHLAGLPAALHARLAAALQQHQQLAPHAAAVLALAGQAVEAALAACGGSVAAAAALH